MRRRPPRLLWLGVCAALVIAAAGCGGDDDSSSISVSDAWSRPTSPAVAVGVVYLTLRSPDDDALVGATLRSDIAAMVSMHTTEVADVTTMESLRRLDLPAGETVSLEPGGHHLMLEELAAPLAEGESFPLTLDFAAAPSQTITVEVTSSPPAP